jgi:hypothetical protein
VPITISASESPGESATRISAMEYSGDMSAAGAAAIQSAAIAGKMPFMLDKIPDVRDGLTREERVVLYVLHQTQHERGGRTVPTPMLWGRVCEHFYISPEDLSLMLAHLGARR